MTLRPSSVAARVARELGVGDAAAERAHRRRERRDQLGATRGQVGGEEVGQTRAVARERTGRLGGVAVARLRHDAADPALDLLARIVGARSPAGEVPGQLALAVGEHREEERVLRREVAVERLIRQAGFLHDR